MVVVEAVEEDVFQLMHQISPTPITPDEDILIHSSQDVEILTHLITDVEWDLTKTRVG